MIAWLSENLGTILVLAVLLGIVASVIVRLRREKKQGKASCGCGCSGCAMSGSCHHR